MLILLFYLTAKVSASQASFSSARNCKQEHCLGLLHWVETRVLRCSCV